MRLTLKLFQGKQTLPWRNAATLIIATASRKGGVEYLVTQRSPKSSFYPNGICFPGGAVSSADSSEHWISLFKAYGTDLRSLTFLDAGAHCPSIYAENTGYLPPEIILRLTAIRETFEESGVLICRSRDPSAARVVESLYPTLSTDDLRTWQKRVKNQPEAFLSLCQEQRLLPDLEALLEWNNWLTPTMFPARYRFDTMFYVTTLKGPPQVVIDQEEVVDAYSASADQLLSASKTEGQVCTLPPPQVYELTRMKAIADLRTLKRFAEARQRKGLECWCPTMIKIKDGILSTLPGDDLYPDPPNLETHVDINRLDSSYADLNTSTKNHNRMLQVVSAANPRIINVKEVLVNGVARYGHEYP